MTRTTTIVLAAVVVLSTAAVPAHAAGYVGLEVSNGGLGFGFGTSNWGIWGSSWDSAVPSYGFSATLAGYGEWVRVDGLGQVWRPWVAAGWQPYTHGRWVWTSLGWTWVAYEPWGWAPHHYGNWAYSTVGWVWSPGYAYHPGNVVWVSSGIHVGWYPCAPVGWSHFNRGYYQRLEPGLCGRPLRRLRLRIRGWLAGCQVCDLGPLVGAQRRQRGPARRDSRDGDPPVRSLAGHRHGDTANAIRGRTTQRPLGSRDPGGGATGNHRRSFRAGRPPGGTGGGGQAPWAGDRRSRPGPGRPETRHRRRRAVRCFSRAQEHRDRGPSQPGDQAG